MSMVRKQVFITAEQNRLLKAHARATGQPEAEIVREAIDLALNGAVERDWREQLDCFVKEQKDYAFEDFAQRVEQNKRDQREKWLLRIAETRRKLSDV
jgi:predicted DNA-binding protein